MSFISRSSAFPPDGAVEPCLLAGSWEFTPPLLLLQQCSSLPSAVTERSYLHFVWLMTSCSAAEITGPDHYSSMSSHCLCYEINICALIEASEIWHFSDRNRLLVLLACIRTIMHTVDREHGTLVFIGFHRYTRTMRCLDCTVRAAYDIVFFGFFLTIV